MLFVAIAQHTPAQCPGSNKEVRDLVRAAMPTVPELEKKHGVKNLGTHVLLGSHKTVMILEAPSFQAAELVLLESQQLAWNTVELALAYTPEEAMKLVPADD